MVWSISAIGSTRVGWVYSISESERIERNRSGSFPTSLSGVKIELTSILIMYVLPKEDKVKIMDKDFKFAAKLTPGENRLVKTGQFFPTGDTSIEKAWRTRGAAAPKIANAANYYGLNYLKTGQSLAKPDIGYGHIFFTRPRLRLTYDNLIKKRAFAMMLEGDENSVASIVRAYLDPVGHKAGKFKCPRVDMRNPFIPILSNNCIDASGWPDIPMDPYTSNPGLRGEVYSLADGHPVNYGSATITATFENVKNDFINYLFHVWTQYAMYSHSGVMLPYKDDWLFNRINYNTRIYRLVTDPTGTYILDMAMTGASIPINSNKSSIYDYKKGGGEHKNKALDESSIQFQSNGTYIFDPIVLKQFNQVMLMFCPTLHPEVRAKHFHRLTMQEKPYFTNLALPYINLKNARLEWYVDMTTYKNEMKILGV